MDNVITVPLSECFRSLQGEGPSVGTPAHFIRLQGCPVGCQWCDSKYTWDLSRARHVSLEELQAAVTELGPAPLVVITGGEPLAYSGLPHLLRWATTHWPRIEVETSGLHAPPATPPTVWWNWSPKLSDVTPNADQTWTHSGDFKRDARFSCKVVVDSEPAWDEAVTRIHTAGIEPRHVCIMPEGLRASDIQERARWLAPRCIDAGYRLTLRMHVDLWGARRGV